MLNEPHLCVLFVVQSEAADGVAVFDGRGPPGALETETHRWRELGVQLVGQIPHHTQGILQTLNTKEEDNVDSRGNEKTTYWSTTVGVGAKKRGKSLK